ncbi:hypothetical protein L2E82_13963 [Cichorium intybus]|uniref:Uncharacterized protein n=1 Tax=Cichorium intybus TaxID=13427 RepID=A0ACB9EYS1_CICIN|nr:hypothetical protein L2E82_13963 [Cichorium intybus]
MNGKEVKVVIQKTVFSSDLLKNQNRLSMPMKRVETHDFLTENEKRHLDNKKEIVVPLLGPRLQMHHEPMVLTIWQMVSSRNYVLKTNWNGFVDRNEEDLKLHSLIQVWSFRMEEQLCFAIVCLEGDDDGPNDDAAAINV